MVILIEYAALEKNGPPRGTPSLASRLILDTYDERWQTELNLSELGEDKKREKMLRESRETIFKRAVGAQQLGQEVMSPARIYLKTICWK